MSTLHVRSISKQYAGSEAAVDGVSFTVAEGTLTTLLGPSGCGKTTTLRMIAGIDAPTKGHVYLGETDVTEFDPERRSVSMVFQSYALFPHLTVEQNVLFSLEARQVDAKLARQKTAAALDMVGLNGLGNRRAPDLSGGQQQRVALARALALAPAVLLLDEPLSNVDIKLRRSLREEIRSLQKRLNLTVVYVTHDQREAMAVSDQIVLMKAGRVEQVGSPHELFERPSTEFVARFMGDASIFDALGTDGQKIQLGALELPYLPGCAPGKLRLVIRPEAWRFGPAVGAGLPGSVLAKTYLGKAFEYLVSSPLGKILVLDGHTEQSLDIGAPVSLYLAPHGVSVLSGPC
jgi:iron(III) transport system ATP-binding protein